jgi:hypothetical protein
LEHWVINREWWRDPEAQPGQPELEFWRVEASPGQGMPPGVYELRRDAPTGIWTLRRGFSWRWHTEGTGTRLFIEHDGFDLSDPYQAASRRILGAGRISEP